MDNPEQPPAHIANYRAITFSGGWYTHEHEHGHPPDKPGAQHADGINHRHEHRWHPDERHHHDPATDDHDPVRSADRDDPDDHGGAQ